MRTEVCRLSSGECILEGSEPHRKSVLGFVPPHCPFWIIKIRKCLYWVFLQFFLSFCYFLFAVFVSAKPLSGKVLNCL